MITGFPVKNSIELDIGENLRRHIQSCYSNDMAQSQSVSCDYVNRLRTRVVASLQRPENFKDVKNTLLEYFGVLRVIEVKLASFQAYFTWYDAFGRRNRISFFFVFFLKFLLVALQSLRYEKAAVIWNIASCTSQQARSLPNIDNVEEIKKLFLLLKVYIFFFIIVLILGNCWLVGKIACLFNSIKYSKHIG
jgi:hypothetical protein